MPIEEHRTPAQIRTLSSNCRRIANRARPGDRDGTVRDAPHARAPAEAHRSTLGWKEVGGNRRYRESKAYTQELELAGDRITLRETAAILSY